ncbi:LCP family protein [Leifsonia sp. A12D58]|uniref:LCP family glycopolymer transferase n=1 Tax=Leifsonia sp. A12D58 TaxID=3397674 RepID=UPI0039DF6AAA
MADADAPHEDVAAPSATPLARHGRLPAPSAVVELLRIAGVALVVLLVSATAVVGFAIWNVTSGLGPGVSLPNDTAGPVPAIDAIDGGVNLLLVGSDSGGGDPAYGERGENLNDVTMLMHIAQDHSSATVVSFPRDMLVEIPECPPSSDGTASGTDGGFTDKINTTLSYGGLACTVKAVQELTGVTIPFAAEIEFNGVIEMSNAVGGVPVCVSERIDDAYTGLVLEPGTHVLQGTQALQFLRTRHGLVSGSDLARIGNQQAFLASLVRTIKSDGTLNDPVKLYSIAKAAADNMVLSSSLQKLDTMVSIAVALKDIDLTSVSFVQYPVVEVDGNIEPLTEDATVLFDALKNDKPISLSGTLGQANQATPTETPTLPAPVETIDPDAIAAPDATDAASALPAIPPTPSPTATGPLVLPPSISGQSAAEETCTVGQTASG